MPVLSVSILKTIPNLSFLNFTSSANLIFVSPQILAMPLSTDFTIPTSSMWDNILSFLSSASIAFNVF